MTTPSYNAINLTQPTESESNAATETQIVLWKSEEEEREHEDSFVERILKALGEEHTEEEGEKEPAGKPEKEVKDTVDEETEAVTTGAADEAEAQVTDAVGDQIQEAIEEDGEEYFEEECEEDIVEAAEENVNIVTEKDAERGATDEMNVERLKETTEEVVEEETEKEANMEVPKEVDMDAEKEVVIEVKEATGMTTEDSTEIEFEVKNDKDAQLEAVKSRKNKLTNTKKRQKAVYKDLSQKNQLNLLNEGNVTGKLLQVMESTERVQRQSKKLLKKSSEKAAKPKIQAIRRRKWNQLPVHSEYQDQLRQPLKEVAELKPQVVHEESLNIPIPVGKKRPVLLPETKYETEEYIRQLEKRLKQALDDVMELKIQKIERSTSLMTPTAGYSVLDNPLGLYQPAFQFAPEVKSVYKTPMHLGLSMCHRHADPGTTGSLAFLQLGRARKASMSDETLAYTQQLEEKLKDSLTEEIELKLQGIKYMNKPLTSTWANGTLMMKPFPSVVLGATSRSQSYKPVFFGTSRIPYSQGSMGMEHGSKPRRGLVQTRQSQGATTIDPSFKYQGLLRHRLKNSVTRKEDCDRIFETSGPKNLKAGETLTTMKHFRPRANFVKDKSSLWSSDVDTKRLPVQQFSKYTKQQKDSEQKADQSEMRSESLSTSSSSITESLSTFYGHLIESDEHETTCQSDVVIPVKKKQRKTTKKTSGLKDIPRKTNKVFRKVYKQSGGKPMIKRKVTNRKAQDGPVKVSPKTSPQRPYELRLETRAQIRQKRETRQKRLAGVKPKSSAPVATVSLQAASKGDQIKYSALKSNPFKPRLEIARNLKQSV